MKRISAIACLTMIMVMMTSMFAFSFGAETFKIDSTYPKDGATNTTKDNMCVKVYFNNEVGNATSKTANKNEVKITNESGSKSYPTKIVYSSKDKNYALILLDTTKVKTTGKSSIKDNTVYKCTISQDFVDNHGNKLGTDKVISFKTMNQGRNTSVYMVMMVLMFGGMFGFSALQMKKQKEKDQGGQAKEEAFNPYKEAKRTGKPVEEVMAKHEKEVEKERAHKKAKAKLEKEMDDMYADNDNYRVHQARPISAAGCTYKTGRSRLAELKKAEKEAKRAELKATDYGKNPKGAKKK